MIAALPSIGRRARLLVVSGVAAALAVSTIVGTALAASSEIVFCVWRGGVTRTLVEGCLAVDGTAYATRAAAEMALKARDAAGKTQVPESPPPEATAPKAVAATPPPAYVLPPKPVPEQAPAPAPAPRIARQEPPTFSQRNFKVTSSGTGIVISRDGHILTNEHVVNGCSRVTAAIPPYPGKQARVLRTNESEDLALIQAEGQWTATARFRVQPQVRPGEAISLIGFPLRMFLSSDPSISSGIVNARSGLGDDIRMFRFSAPIQPGNSGGPILDASGNVVGIVSHKLSEFAAAKFAGSLSQNVNFGVKAGIAGLFVEGMGLALDIGAEGQAQDLAALFDRAKHFTALIECWEPS